MRVCTGTCPLPWWRTCRSHVPSQHVLEGHSLAVALARGVGAVLFAHRGRNKPAPFVAVVVRTGRCAFPPS